MRRLATALGLAALVAAGGAVAAAPPRTALLTDVRVEPARVVFAFRSAPGSIRVRYRPRSQIVEAGSGRPVALAGTAFLVVTFTPAATADLSTGKVVPTYTGPRRLRPVRAGRVREVVKIGDFEAQLDWAVGLDRRRPYRVTRAGARVTLSVR